MMHVTDELDLFAFDLLAPADRERVIAHLGRCPACREQARLVEEVAHALPDTLPVHEATPRLRERILASAQADVAARAKRPWIGFAAGRLSARLAVAALTGLVLVLGAIDIRLMQERDDFTSERAATTDVLMRVAQGGRSWYMAGRDAWAGSGGTLYVPAKPDAAAFVVFHDLRPLDAGSVYTLWFIDPDGHWVRAANFTRTAEPAQAVVLDASIEGFAQCAVTVEHAREGKRAGPLVMQSRITPPAQ